MKKIILIMMVITIITTGCGKKEKDPKILLCDDYTKDYEKYKNNQMTIDEITNKIEEYNNSCQDESHALCIALESYSNSIKYTNDLKDDYKDAYLFQIDRQCKLLYEEYNK